MKKYILLITTFLISTFAFSQNQERLSVHYFDIPENLEAEYLEFNKKMNQEIENAGFGKNFYKIYKVKSDDEAKIYRYFQISSYTSDKHYKMTHDVSPEYEALIESFWNSDMAKILPMDDKDHIYRKVYRIE
jgi:hypothetical protein